VKRSTAEHGIERVESCRFGGRGHAVQVVNADWRTRHVKFFFRWTVFCQRACHEAFCKWRVVEVAKPMLKPVANWGATGSSDVLL